MRERGLYQFGAMLFAATLIIAALAYVIGGDEGAEAASAAIRAEPQAGDVDRRQDDDAAASDAVCVPDGAPQPLPREIRESSGVAVSRAHAGIFWTHNDSGQPLLYAVDAHGRAAGQVRVDGASVEDWEDIALAPCPAGGDCLYVADIGDNEAARPSITIYRIPEPAPDAARSAPAAAIRLRYPDGPHDAEAMFVLDGAIHVVTKGESGPIALYRAPAAAAAGAETPMQRIRLLSTEKVDRPQRITGADASADGRWVALRTLESASLYRAAELAGSGGAPPLRVDLRALGEKQGEGIGFAADGSLLLSSEGRKKEPGTFSRLTCTLP